MIGVTLSVSCSNMRLFSISSHGRVQEEGDDIMLESHQQQNWAKIIIETASTSAENIQSANQFEIIETGTDITHENDHSSSESQTDVKRMETVPF